MNSFAQTFQTYLHERNQHFSSQYSILNNVHKGDVVQLLATVASRSIQQTIQKQKQNNQKSAGANSKLDISHYISQWNSNLKKQENINSNNFNDLSIVPLIKPAPVNPNPIYDQQSIIEQTIQVNEQQTVKQDSKKDEKKYQKQRQNASQSYSSAKKYHSNQNRNHHQAGFNRRSSRDYERQSNLSYEYDRESKMHYQKQRDRSRSKHRPRDDQRRYYKDKQREYWDRQKQKEREKQRQRQRDYREREYRDKQRQKDRYNQYKGISHRDPRYYNNNNNNNNNQNLYRFYQKVQDNQNQLYGHPRKFIQNRQSLYHQYSNQYYDYYNREKRYQ